MKMKRKIVLAVLLCLATATLGIGAVPALAASGCTCHTVEPLTAPAAHEPYVAGVTDCTTCHAGWTVPHPTAVEPALTARYVPGQGLAISGGAAKCGLSVPWVPLANVTVYLQRKATDATEWNDLATVVTTAEGWGEKGVLAETQSLDHRAVSQGVAGSPVVMPAVSGSFKRPVPTLTLRLNGLTDGAITRGHAVIARGKALPTELAGQKVFLRLQRSYAWPGGPHRVWRTVSKATRTIRAASDFSWRFTPKARGQYRIRTFVEATAAYRGVTTDWRPFRVK